MDFWYYIQLHKWYSAGWALTFAFSLVLLFVGRNNQKEKIRKLCIFVSLSLLLYYCQIFASVMLRTFLPGYLEYERLSWIFFAREIVAFSFVVLVNKFDKKKRLLAFAIFLVFCLYLSNTNLITYGFHVPQNLYKLSEDVVEIGDALIAHTSEKKPTVLIQSDSYDTNQGDEMFHGIRQYTSNPVLYDVYLSSEEYEAEDFDLSAYGILNFEFFVCHNEVALRNQAESFGFELIKETKKYCLFKNEKEFTLFFVRHGQTDANVAGIYAGSGTDSMLTVEGINQAKTTGEALSDILFSNVFTSELTRTKYTANLILEQNNNGTPEPKALPYLDDFYWGNVEGMTDEEVRELYPDFDLTTYIGTLDDQFFVSPIDAGSKYYTVTRLRRALDQIVTSTEKGGNVLVVGHSAMIWCLQDMFPEQVEETDGIDNASVTILHYNRGKWTLEELNLSAEEFKELKL